MLGMEADETALLVLKYEFALAVLGALLLRLVGK